MVVGSIPTDGDTFFHLTFVLTASFHVNFLLVMIQWCAPPTSRLPPRHPTTRFFPHWMTKMVIIRWCAPPPALLLPHHPTARFSSPKPPSVVYAKSSSPASSSTTRRALSLSLIFSSFTCSYSSSSEAATSEFFELRGSGGVKALDLRTGSGEVPVDGDQVIPFPFSQFSVYLIHFFHVCD